MFHPLKFSVGRIYRNESLRPETFLGGDSIARHRPFPAVSAESRPSVLNCDDAVISWRRLPVPVSVRLPVLLRLSLCRHPILRCDEMHDGKPLSSPAMGHCVTCPPLPRLSICLIFLVTSEPHKLWHWTLWLPIPRKNIHGQVVYSLVTVYCINFIIFCVCHPMNYFLLISCSYGNKRPTWHDWLLEIK